MKGLYILMLSLVLPVTVKAREGVHVQDASIRFMVLGDAHHSSPSADPDQTILYEIAIAAIREEVDFVFFAGDLVVRGSDSPEEEEAMLRDLSFVLDTLGYNKIRVYACRGNNDVSSRSAWDSLFSDSLSFPSNGPEMEKNLSYFFEYENLLFIVLDQYVLEHRINQAWLEEILASHKSEHIVVAAHEPAFELTMPNCMVMYPEDRDFFWESLSDAGVKIYFCAHDHFYDHAILDDGDGNPDNDVHQVISGTGGGFLRSETEYTGDFGRWIPGRIFHEDEYGYVLVEVKGPELEMIWKHRTGQHSFEEGGDTFVFSPGSTGIEETGRAAYIQINYPNPFSSGSTIRYSVPSACHLRICISDLAGREVATLVNERKSPGSFEIEWNAESLESGLYLCTLHSGNRAATGRIILIQ